MNILMHTMHISTSIGAALQSCALGKKLSGMGHSPYLLYYTPPFYSDISMQNTRLSSLREKISHFINGRVKEKARLSFVDFKGKNHPPLTRKYIDIEELKADPPVFDAYICGSDQVWNPMITHYDPSYFFPFVNNGTKKISYAASIGCDTVTSEIENYLRNGLPYMDHIGVREDTAVCAIKKLLQKAEVTQNIDPTFLLDREAWKMMAVKPEGRLPQKYILYYPINKTAQGTEILHEVKREYLLPCVTFSSAIRKSKGVDINLHGVGPAEFLYLCNHADVVVTNSFHGFALSVIMGKSVICFTKSGQNTRMESLSRLLNLKDLMVSDINDVKSKNWHKIWESSYKGIAEAIEREQKRADEYLREALR